jgi:hypothetical protein
VDRTQKVSVGCRGECRPIPERLKKDAWRMHGRLRHRNNSHDVAPVLKLTRKLKVICATRSENDVIGTAYGGFQEPHHWIFSYLTIFNY